VSILFPTGTSGMANTSGSDFSTLSRKLSFFSSATNGNVMALSSTRIIILSRYFNKNPYK